MNALIYVSFIFTMIMNSLGAIGGFFSLENVASVSDKYQGYLVPAGFTFSIWSIIYILWIYYIYCIVKNLKKNKSYNNLAVALILSNIFNGSWIYFWVNEYLLLSQIFIFLLLFSLIYSFRKLKKEKPSTLFLNSVSVYLAWVSIASVLNFSSLIISALDSENNLIYNLFEPSTWVMWSVGLLCITLMLGSMALYFYRSYTYVAVYIWAYYGIYSNLISKNVSDLLVNNILINIFVLLALSLFFWFKRENKSPS